MCVNNMEILEFFKDIRKTEKVDIVLQSTDNINSKY